MQKLVLESGDPSVAAIAKIVHCSHQAVYKALTGPNLPSRTITKTLVEALAGQEAAKEILRLWTDAVDESRSVDSTPPDQKHQKPGPAHQQLLTVLGELRNRSRWKVELHANRASMGRSTVYAILAGRYLPSWTTLERLVSQLGGDPAQFRQLWELAFDERRTRRRGQ
ncbi:helix-turn-helix domain-containing protein [Nonomuraea glycinis]|uniref:helix-turn-helix domain-containing protein n=1 Tax=Nonomuraea glycinis TaxID=2047744 RepID=UPI00389A3393